MLFDFVQGNVSITQKELNVVRFVGMHLSFEFCADFAERKLPVVLRGQLFGLLQISQGTCT